MKQKPTEPQASFLLCPAIEAMYGGGAGGGKSSGLLMAAAQFLDTPGYNALLLRRSFADLMQPEALIPRSKEWWKGTGARWSVQEKRWTFPSGATITFGYLERDDDVYQYHGAAYQFIGFDELTQHTEFRYRYLFSRLRRLTGSSIPLRMRSSANPGGLGHAWVKERFIKPRLEGAVFVPALAKDNPHLDLPTYLESLSHLDPFTRAQLLAGDWDAVPGGRFKHEWFRDRRYRRDGDYVVLGDRRVGYGKALRFLTVDPAASAKETAKKSDPDWTVISAWLVTPLNELVWLDCIRGRWEVPDIVPQIQAVWDRWQPAYVAIEGGGMQKAVYQLVKRTKMAAKELLPQPGMDKLVKATPAIVLAESGRVWLPASAGWLEEAEAELLRFTGDDKKDAHDDVVDTLAWAARLLVAKEQQVGFAPYTIGMK